MSEDTLNVQRTTAIINCNNTDCNITSSTVLTVYNSIYVSTAGNYFQFRLGTGWFKARVGVIR